MSIFNNSTVVGLFDNGKDVENALARLQEYGFGRDDEDEIQIIDEHRLAQELPVDTLGQRIIAQPDHGLAAGSPAAVYDPDSQAGVAAGTLERNAQEVLTGMGIGESEASFFARHIARGNPVVVVDTTEERASEAFKIMREANARTMEE
jgi:hypothetical protein